MSSSQPNALWMSRLSDGAISGNSLCTVIFNLPEMTLEPNIPLPPLSLQVLRNSLANIPVAVECYDLAAYGPRIAEWMSASDFEQLFRANREMAVLSAADEYGLDLPPACLDAVIKSGLIDKVISTVHRLKPKLVGFSLQGTPLSSDLFTVGLCKILAGKLRAAWPSLPMVVGGARTIEKKNIQQELMKETAIDFLVRGNGHRSIRQLVNGLLSGNLEPEDVRGLIYRHEGRLRQNEADPPWGHLAVPIWLDRDALPYYRRTIDELTPRARHVVELEKMLGQEVCVAPFQFTVGCVSECAFCNRASEVGKISRPTEVVDQIENAVQKYGIRDFLFLNSELNFGPTYVHRFCDEIIRRRLNINWIDSCEFRGLDVDTLKVMREAGCVGLWFGLESASNRMLTYIQKRVSSEHAAHMLYEADRLGLYCCINFICGLPYEREEDVHATLSFLKDHREVIDSIEVNAFYLQNGPFVDNPEQFGISIRDYQEQVGPTMCRAFDEVREGGLCWEEKRQQILSAFGRVSGLAKEIFPYESRNMLLVIALHKAFEGNKRMMRRAIQCMGDISTGNLLSNPARLVQYGGEIYLLDLVREAILKIEPVVARVYALRHLKIWRHIRGKLLEEFSLSDVNAALEAIKTLEADGYFLATKEGLRLTAAS